MQQHDMFQTKAYTGRQVNKGSNIDLSINDGPRYHSREIDENDISHCLCEHNIVAEKRTGIP